MNEQDEEEKVAIKKYERSCSMVATCPRRNGNDLRKFRCVIEREERGRWGYVDRSGKVRNDCAGDVALKIYRSNPMICHCLLHFYANSLPQTVSLSLHLHTLWVSFWRTLYLISGRFSVRGVAVWSSLITTFNWIGIPFLLSFVRSCDSHFASR